MIGPLDKMRIDVLNYLKIVKDVPARRAFSILACWGGL